MDSQYYDLIIQYPNGASAWVDTFRNRGTAIKEARIIAMTEQVGFNIETDLIQ